MKRPGDLKGVAEKARPLGVRRSRAEKVFLRGNGHNIGKIVKTTPAARVSIVDSQDRGKLLRTRHACSPELLNVRFLDAFAWTQVHDRLSLSCPNTILIATITFRKSTEKRGSVSSTQVRSVYPVRTTGLRVSPP